MIGWESEGVLRERFSLLPFFSLLPYFFIIPESFLKTWNAERRLGYPRFLKSRFFSWNLSGRAAALAQVLNSDLCSRYRLIEDFADFAGEGGGEVGLLEKGDAGLQDAMM